MPEKRMMSKKIVDSDPFLEMPLSAQALYLHLLVRADDDGFVNNPKKIIRCIGASQEDFNVLVEKRFILCFESGVIVIKHWRIHNYIRGDRYHETQYMEEKSRLKIKENGAYTMNIKPDNSIQNNDVIPNGNQLPTSGMTCDIPNAYQMDTEIRLDQISIDKTNNIVSKDTIRSTDVQRVIEEWNSLGLRKVTKLVPGTQRYSLLRKRIQDYGLVDVLRAIKLIHDCPFLLGHSDRGWQITFDWFVKPNNFPKVLDGNYLDKTASDLQVSTKKSDDWQ